MKSNILILIVFAVLALVMTYPLVLHMHQALLEPGDSLLVAWTISWDVNKLINDPVNLFNANIFYPYKYTLAYSEHMIGIALTALPIYFFIHNPLVIYNLMLLLSFVLCGWGGYLLVYYLTGDRVAGITAGIIFAFCPYRFEQLGHLHVLSCQWIPFTLLFLHKLCNCRSRKWRYELGFAFFFFLQFISSGHNGLYLAAAVIFFLIYFAAQIRWRPWIVFSLTGVLLIPFYYPYLYLARVMGYERLAVEFELYSPQIGAYCAVLRENWLYGRYLSRFCRPEAVMFPGIVPLILIFWGRIPKFKRAEMPLAHRRGVNRVINIMIVIALLIIAVVLITGGINLGITVMGVGLKVADCARPVAFLLMLFFLKAVVNWQTTKNMIRNLTKKLAAGHGPEQYYWFLMIAAFLFSFGPVIRIMDKDFIWGPYNLLYNFFPGFKGLRVPGRIYTLFILSLAVLAGFGVGRLRKASKRMFYTVEFPEGIPSTENRLKVITKRFSCLAWVIPVILLVEYLHVPLSLKCWIGTKPPAVYRWLAEQPEETAILELPMPDWYSQLPHEIGYQYWSLYHGKRLVNGYSGYFPPIYWPVAERMKYFPDEDSIEIIRNLGVDMVIVHDWDIKRWGWPDVLAKMDNYSDIFSREWADNGDYVFKVMKKRGNIPTRKYSKKVARDQWSVTASHNNDNCYKAIDNDPETRWDTEKPQEAEMIFEIDMGQIKEITALSMDFDKASGDYPRGIRLEVSRDGESWQEVLLKFIYANYVEHLLQYPQENRMTLDFEPVEARYIRLIQTGRHKIYFWSLYDLNVYQ